MTIRLSLLPAVLAAVVTTLLLLPGTAWAASNATIASPGRDAVVSSPVELRVRVTRDVLDPPARRVQVRLSGDGASAAPGSGPVDLTCQSGCDSTESVWGGRSFDPATAAPFGGGPACNGRWYLQVAVDGGAFGSGSAVVASAPASPARDVRVAIDGRDAILTWGRAPEPDIAGYRVERRGSGSWTTVGEVGADATRLVDADVDEGSYEWRVVTLRPDGRGSAPCEDRDADLATTSTVARGRVTEPPPAPSPSPSPSTSPSPDGEDTAVDAGSGDDGTSGDGSGGAPSPAAGEVATAPDGSATDTSGRASAPAGDGAAVAAPATAGTAAAPETAAPERYYGEEQGVGTLDYGEVGSDGVPPAAAPAGGTWVPGGVSVMTEQLDQARILRPVAGGMVLLTFAFHIRRWQREQDV